MLLPKKSSVKAYSLAAVTSAAAITLTTAVPSQAVTDSNAAVVPSSATALANATWKRDWHADFNGPLSSAQWGRYGFGYQPVGHGAMGVYKPENAYTHDGVLALRTRYTNGAWSAAGISSGRSFAASGGKWEVRAKMPRATGIGYAFLLYPADGSWPPEVDIAEGRVNGTVGSFYHYGANNDQKMSKQYVDTHQWHTYGVIFGDNQMIFTIDGNRVSGVLTDVPVTTKKMWLGFQTGAFDPNGSARQYETVPGGVPNALTPASSEVQIAWAAHYHR